LVFSYKLISLSIFVVKTHQNYTYCFCYGPTTQKLVLQTLQKYVNFLDLVYIHTSWQHCVHL